MVDAGEGLFFGVGKINAQQTERLDDLFPGAPIPRLAVRTVGGKVLELLHRPVGLHLDLPKVFTPSLRIEGNTGHSHPNHGRERLVLYLDDPLEIGIFDLSLKYLNKWHQNLRIARCVGEHLFGEPRAPVGILVLLVELDAQLSQGYVLEVMKDLWFAIFVTHATSSLLRDSLSSVTFDISIVSSTRPRSPGSKPIVKRTPRSKSALCIMRVLSLRAGSRGAESTSKQSTR